MKRKFWPANGTSIVPAWQKRQQSINTDGLSITAATGGQLAERRVTLVQDLVKVVTGLSHHRRPTRHPCLPFVASVCSTTGLASSQA